MGKARRFDSHSNAVNNERAMAQMYGQARQNLSGVGSTFRSGALSVNKSTQNPTIASAGDNLGNHTATQDVNLSDNDIINLAELVFNNSGIIDSTKKGISALADSMYYNVPSTDSHLFMVDGTIKFEVNDQIDVRRNDVKNFSRAMFDEDDDTYIAGEHYSAISDDELEFYTGGSLRFKIDNTTITAAENFTVYGNTILGLSSSETIQMVGRLTTSIIPNADNAVDLGSATSE